MANSVAVLIDAGYIWKNAKRVLNRFWKASDIMAFARACLINDETLYRVFFYDCLPFSGERHHILDNSPINYAESELYKRKHELLKQIATMDYIAFRQGRLAHKGWKLRDNAFRDLIAGRKKEIKKEDIVEDFRQKRVDMKIGLDVAWLSSRGIASSIVLIGSDTDYIPAMKHARREGSRVIIAGFLKNDGSPDLHPDLREHADECRMLKYEDNSFKIKPVSGCM